MRPLRPQIFGGCIRKQRSSGSVGSSISIFAKTTASQEVRIRKRRRECEAFMPPDTWWVYSQTTRIRRRNLRNEFGAARIPGSVGVDGSYFRTKGHFPFRLIRAQRRELGAFYDPGFSGTILENNDILYAGTATWDRPRQKSRHRRK